MRTYEAPAKLNLSLHVNSPRADGYHPLQSLVQTIDWCDELDVREGEGADQLEVVGSDLKSEDNLVLTALERARSRVSLSPLHMVLRKHLPLAAGLGGGSSDAAAALIAAADMSELHREDLPKLALDIGADVALFFDGGSMLMEGVGEIIKPQKPQSGFAFGVVVPAFGLPTADVYARWDTLGGPLGDPVHPADLPPGLRGGMPMRNDLLPAAIDLEPRLGDFISDVRREWGRTVCLTGSGSACFGYFTSLDEAVDATSGVRELCQVARGVGLRDRGVASV